MCVLGRERSDCQLLFSLYLFPSLLDRTCRMTQMTIIVYPMMYPATSQLADPSSSTYYAIAIMYIRIIQGVIMYPSTPAACPLASGWV